MTLNFSMTSSNVGKFIFCHRKLKFKTLIENVIFYKILNLGSIGHTVTFVSDNFGTN